MGAKLQFLLDAVCDLLAGVGGDGVAGVGEAVCDAGQCQDSEDRDKLHAIAQSSQTIMIKYI